MLAREGGSCSSDDPDLDVGGCLAHQWGDDANDSYEIDLDLVVGGFARGSEEGVVVFASVGDDEFDESRFGSGHDHGDCDLVGVGPHVFSDDGDEAVGEVRGQIHVILLHIFLAVLVGGADGDLAGAGVDEHVRGMGKGWTFLDMMVGEEMEGVVLGVDGGLVVDGAIFVFEDGPGGDMVAVHDLGAVAVGDDVAAVGAQFEEAMEGSLDVVDGHGVSLGRPADGEEKGDESTGPKTLGERKFHRVSNLLLK